MKRIYKNAHAFAVLLTSLVLALSPFHLFPVCSTLMKNGQHMSCHYSAIYWVMTAFAVSVFAILMWMVKKKVILSILYGLTTIASVLGYLIPKRLIQIGQMKIQGWQIGLCTSPDMACRSTTMPVVEILLLILGALGILGLSMMFLIEGRAES